ncbi:MAG: hypothetical protein V1816_03255 [Pseudomonadota bacterium]
MVKIAELREIIKKYDQDELRLIIAAIYKALPPKIREEKELDAIISNPAALKEKKADKKQEAVDIDWLKLEINDFIEDAKAQYYLGPNRYISKKDRPKWRFKVMAFYKDLTRAAVNANDLPLVADMMEELYKLLCYACGTSLFNTDDPFESIRIRQIDFFHSLLSLKFQVLDDKAIFIRDALLLIRDNNTSRFTDYSALITVFVQSLKTPSLKELAVEACRAMSTEEELPRPAQKNTGYMTFLSTIKNKIPAEAGLFILIALGDYQAGADFFNRYYEEEEKEVRLYVLLRYLSEFNLTEQWRLEYERAVADQVEPRAELRLVYRFIQENNRLPEAIMDVRPLAYTTIIVP